MSVPTIIFSKTHDDRTFVVIDVSGFFYLQSYKINEGGSTVMLQEESWSTADKAIDWANKHYENYKG